MSMCPWTGGVRPAGLVAQPVIVVGSRTFDDYDFMKRKLDRLCYWFDDVLVISGGQRSRDMRMDGWHYFGADYFAEKWADENWYVKQIFHADWKKYGKNAGPRRNLEMVRYGASLRPKSKFVAVWDGRSSGTEDCIARARELLPRKNIKIYTINT